MVKHAKKPLYTSGDIKVYEYDTVDYLDSDEAIAGYLSVSLTEDYEPQFFLAAIADALRAKGLNTIESLLTIAEEMRPPSVSSDTAPIAIKTAGKPAAKRSVNKTTGKKSAARKTSSHLKPRRKRETAVA